MRVRNDAGACASAPRLGTWFAQHGCCSGAARRSRADSARRRKGRGSLADSAEGSAAAPEGGHSAGESGRVEPFDESGDAGLRASPLALTCVGRGARVLCRSLLWQATLMIVVVTTLVLGGATGPLVRALCPRQTVSSHQSIMKRCVPQTSRKAVVPYKRCGLTQACYLPGS